MNKHSVVRLAAFGSFLIASGASVAWAEQAPCKEPTPKSAPSVKTAVKQSVWTRAQSDITRSFQPSELKQSARNIGNEIDRDYHRLMVTVGAKKR
jgi:hypothetical protein